MFEQNAKFDIGERIQVSDQCFSPLIQGAVGVVSRPPAEVVVHDASWRSYWKFTGAEDSEDLRRVYWIEFDPLVPAEDPTHPIEAAEIDETDLMRHPR